VAANLRYCWKDEAEQRVETAPGRRSAAGGVDQEQAKCVKQLQRALGPKQLEIEILKNVLGEWKTLDSEIAGRTVNAVTFTWK
jgi:hypothetical protein